MLSRLWLGSIVGLVVVGGARADVWDAGPANDNAETGTQNEFVHGSDQLHDLAALPGPVADLDWYRIGQKPYSSYEIVVDSTAASLNPGLQLDRVGSDGVSVIQGALAVTTSLGFSRSLRWQNATGSSVDTQYVRVLSNSCTTSCTANDVYRIRAYETTCAISRFNNAGSQVTVLVLQNPRSYTIGGSVYFWNGAGTLLHSHPFGIPARQSLVLSLPSILELAGQSGSITIAHDGRYGDLSGKAVALEPATGYTFDTPLTQLPK